MRRSSLVTLRTSSTRSRRKRRPRAFCMRRERRAGRAATESALLSPTRGKALPKRSTLHASAKRRFCLNLAAVLDALALLSQLRQHCLPHTPESCAKRDVKLLQLKRTACAQQRVDAVHERRSYGVRASVQVRRCGCCDVVGKHVRTVLGMHLHT